ncbi:MAG: hypothetical protein ABI307_01555 [Mycobacterium sp.]
MNPTTSGLDRSTRDERRWPGYLLGGRVRTSTVALIVVFALVWWVYDAYRPTPKSIEAPQVVPPGFIPDPNYTWVPRTRLQRPPATVTETVTPTPTTAEPTPPIPTSEIESPPPPLFPFPLPPPFGPPAPPPQPPPVSPGVPAPSPVPASPPAAPATRSPP